MEIVADLKRNSPPVNGTSNVITKRLQFNTFFPQVRNRRRECEIASKCTKTAGQVLASIAEQTATPVLVTYFEGVKTDACSSLLLFSQ